MANFTEALIVVVKNIVISFAIWCGAAEKSCRHKATVIDAASIFTITNPNQRLNPLDAHARVKDAAGSLKAIHKQIEDALAEIMKVRLAKFDAQAAQLKIDDPSDYAIQGSGRKGPQPHEQRHARVMDEYYKAADTTKAKLEAVPQPDMVNRFTATDFQKVRQNLPIGSMKRMPSRMLLIEQQNTNVRAEAVDGEKTYGEVLDASMVCRKQVSGSSAKSNKLKSNNPGLVEQKAQKSPAVSADIQPVTQLTAQQRSLTDRPGKMMQLVNQVDNSWVVSSAGHPKATGSSSCTLPRAPRPVSREHVHADYLPGARQPDHHVPFRRHLQRQRSPGDLFRYGGYRYRGRGAGMATGAPRRSGTA